MTYRASYPYLKKKIRNTFEVNHLKHMYLFFNYKILIKLSSLLLRCRRLITLSLDFIRNKLATGQDS